MKHSFFKIDEKVEALAKQAEALCSDEFKRIDEMMEYNQLKVLAAFRDQRISDSHLWGTTGYGYSDRGRDTLDKVYAQVFGCEDALVRHHFASGTHTITTALFGVLRPGDVMVSVSGIPYDTLQAAIGLNGEGMGSLKEFGVEYRQVDLLVDSSFDFEAIEKHLPEAKMVYVQRSRGYTLRDSIAVDKIGELCKFVKERSPNTLVVVDNCYGEFVEEKEPTQVGADLIMGSLIKNPGGGIARTGGYIAGRRDLVELCAYRLTAPGTGREIGCSLDENRNMYMGLFFAPQTTAAALKTAVLCSALFELLGFEVSPKYNDHKTDIICAVKLGTPQRLEAFCQGIQMGAPIDSYVVPEAWDMPGYDSKVIMAAGAFTMGASIELSADGPMREPYAAWMQGGLTYPSGKIGVLQAAQKLLEKGLLD